MKIDYSLILRVENATMTNYNKFKAGDEKTRLMNKNEIENMLEDLLSEIKSLQDLMDDIENDINDNYVKISKKEQIEG